MNRQRGVAVCAGPQGSGKDSAGQKQDSCPAEIFYTLVHILH